MTATPPRCRACGRRDGSHEPGCRAVARAKLDALRVCCDHRPEYGATQTTGDPPGPPCCGRCGLELPETAEQRRARRGDDDPDADAYLDGGRRGDGDGRL